MNKNEHQQFLKTYVINLRQRGERRIQAYGFTNDKEDGLIYLHKMEDLSDKSTFFRIKDISGFEEISSESEKYMPSVDEFNRQYEELRKTPNEEPN